MDIDYKDRTPPSHYVQQVPVAQIEVNQKVKQSAFQSMHLLEGWCSEQKAAVLIDLVLLLKPTNIVEIGVFGGKSLIPMAYALKANGLGKIYGVDPWDNIASIEGMDGVNREYWNQVNHQAILEGLLEKIGQFQLENQVELIRATSAAAPIVPNIDMLHIDGNHSEEASYVDVTKWVPLVRKGGIIIFDDINWSTTGLAVQWLEAHCTKLAEFRGDNIWGIWVQP